MYFILKGNRMKYWGKEQEEAIIEFNKSDDIKIKHKIYNDIIFPAFFKLIENIYYTYNFNTILYDYEQTRHEAMAHLYDKLNKFDPNSGSKSFSYFGTIVKNWMIQQSNMMKKQVSINDDAVTDIYVLDKSLEFYNDTEKEKDDYNFIKELTSNFDLLINNKHFNKEDLAVLEIINDILKNYNKFTIYNKKQLYVYVREATDLPSRKITKSIKKIRATYCEIKESFNE